MGHLPLPNVELHGAKVMHEIPPPGEQWRVIALCGLIAFLDGFDLTAMGLVVPAVALDWHMAAADFRFALSAALLGLMFGTLFIAPLGDRFGRRPLLVTSLVVVGIGSLATASATNMIALTAFRLLTGLGLGASIPNAIALTAEYVPAKRRAFLITLMFAGFPLGAAVAGGVSQLILRHGTWHHVFLSGGAIPIAIALILYFMLPESPRFLHMRQSQPAEKESASTQIGQRYGVAKIRQRLKTSASTTSLLDGPRSLFAEGQRALTLPLWTVFFCNLFMIYLLSSWLTTVLVALGSSNDVALGGASVFLASGVGGGLGLSIVMDRRGAYGTLALAYLLGALALTGLAAFHAVGAVMLMELSVSGAAVIGSQFCINALAADIYPPSIRARGVGWAFGFGRLGAVISPLLGGWLLARGEPRLVIGLAAVPAVICGISAAMIGRARRTLKHASVIAT
jgi:MFS transporter, AAHS family, 4-hydroxybenzoate transporter